MASVAFCKQCRQESKQPACPSRKIFKMLGFDDLTVGIVAGLIAAGVFLSKFFTERLPPGISLTCCSSISRTYTDYTDIGWTSEE
jgi:hypothetical protein